MPVIIFKLFFYCISGLSVAALDRQCSSQFALRGRAVPTEINFSPLLTLMR